MCNLKPPATGLEIRNPPRQFVRKLSGFAVPSKGHQAAFEAASDGVAAPAHRLVASQVTGAEPKNRDIEAVKARAWEADHFGTAQR